MESRYLLGWQPSDCRIHRPVSTYPLLDNEKRRFISPCLVSCCPLSDRRLKTLGWHSVPNCFSAYLPYLGFGRRSSLSSIRSLAFLLPSNAALTSITSSAGLNVEKYRTSLAGEGEDIERKTRPSNRSKQREQKRKKKLNEKEDSLGRKRNDWEKSGFFSNFLVAQTKSKGLLVHIYLFSFLFNNLSSCYFF